MALDKYKVQINKRSVPTQAVQYAKASGIYLLDKYLPELNPFYGFEILKDINQWEQIEKNYSDRLLCRTDNKLGKKPVVIRGTSGKKSDIPDLLEEVKRQDTEGVLLLLQNKYENIPRYKNKGGMTVSFDLGTKVIIELAGKGFDGGDITRGEAIHERYDIPWDKVLYMENKSDLEKDPLVNTYKITEDDYHKTRKRRIEVLESFGEDSKKIQEEVPEQYTPIDDDVMKQILDDIIFKLYSQNSQLKRDKLYHFKVQGNIGPNSKLIPFEIFRPERMIWKKDKEREDI